ncbi:hypothetical protein Tco_0204796 [Tanacetum coccineum]
MDEKMKTLDVTLLLQTWFTDEEVKPLKKKMKPRSFNHESELLHNRFLRCLDVAIIKSSQLYVLNGIAMFLGLENDISFLPMGKKMVKQVKITLGILEAGNVKN